ncbi:TetR/AcrR family transcriptional regulator [Streptomyces sp. NPDC048182]|uniref:TetR/AcrR family transcriptional regulator n=1 Tax=unclassified Streptomyces TaxID=2593676 RepID=UPI0033AE51CE
MTGPAPDEDRRSAGAGGSPRRTAPARPGRPGRRRLVDRERVLDTVAELGFHEITVSSVAQRLGLRPSTLYRYFATREELLADAVDARFADPPGPAAEDGADWRGCLAAHAWGLWEVYAGHPGLAQAVTALPTTPPALTRRIDGAAARLLDLGFAAADAVLAVDVVGELALDTFLLGRIAGKPHGGAGGEDRRARVAAAAPLLDPRLRGLIEDVVTAEPRAWFARKLDLVLDGLTARAPAGGGAAGPTDRGGGGRSVAAP